MGALRTAEALRRFGYAGPITAIGDEPYAPYNRPPLSKEVLANQVSHEAVAFPQRPATADVNWVLGTRVVSTDLEHKTVVDSNGDSHSYSALIAATGLRPKRLQVPNGELAGRHAVRSLDDAIGLRAALVPGARVVILGAGFIGCEVAATARKLGCDVTVVAPGVHPIVRPLGVELAKEIQRRHEAQGVRFIMKTTIVDLIGESHVAGVVLDNGDQLACDVLVEAIGSHANTEWLEGTDIDITKLKGGAKFEELAKGSKDPGSGNNGGDLGWAPQDAFVKPFSDAMVALKAGEITQTPVQTQFGFHVIKLEESRDAQLPTFDEVKGQIAESLQQRKLQEFQQGLKKKAKIQ